MREIAREIVRAVIPFVIAPHLIGLSLFSVAALDADTAIELFTRRLVRVRKGN